MTGGDLRHPGSAREFGQTLFVRGIFPGVQEYDGAGADAVGDRRREGIMGCCLIQRFDLGAVHIDPAALLAHARGTADSQSQQETLIVEGVGGLLVPLTDDYTVCDFASALGLPVVVAARPGLGTINHTLLTLQSARAAGLSVRAVVLTPWPEQPSRLERYNRETIARLGVVEVEVLARAANAEIGELARVGGALPWQRWLGVPGPLSAGPRGSDFWTPRSFGTMRARPAA